MLDLSSEVFSDKYLPPQWVSKQVNLETYKPALKTIFPNLEIAGQLTRSTNTVSFILRGSDHLYVCQLAPPKSSIKVHPLEEKNNPKKFDGALKRMKYLNESGISVPNILSEGVIQVNGQNRQYILVDFVVGISADRFLSHNRQDREMVYYKFGQILGRLSEVTCSGKGSLPAINLLLAKVNHATKFIFQKNVISKGELFKLTMLVKERLESLGNIPTRYVHLDPFPTNLHLTKSETGLKPTLMDIEAIQKGHPIIEGLGRAIMTGIYDWTYITGENSNDTDFIIKSFIDGYSESSVYSKTLKSSKSNLVWLIDTCRLVHLPQSIMYEHKKDVSIFIPDKKSLKWSVETLRKLTNKLASK